MKKLSIISLFATILLGSCNSGEVPESPYSLETSTKFAKTIVENTDGYFGHIKSDVEYNLAPGVSLLDMEYVNAGGYAVRMMVYKVMLGGTATIAVSTPNDQNTLGTLQPLLEQAEAMDARAADYVLGAVNGDSFAPLTSQPNGILYRDGVAVKTTFNTSNGGFFAMLKDGSAAIFSQEDYSSVRNSIFEAVGTGAQILSEGYTLPQSDTSAASRTAVGVSADGTTVYLVAVDGVYFFYSNGITTDDLAAVMKACGASDAALLDSGNNTTVVYRNKQETLEVFNTPNNNGIANPIANGLVVVAR